MRGSRSEPRRLGDPHLSQTHYILMLLETDCFDCGVHDGTADLKRPPRLRVDAAADVQIDAYEFQMETHWRYKNGIKIENWGAIKWTRLYC